jgi:ElaB/YqjD/DUF883 family membrane-anchored ribosome-binding protein
MLSSQRNGQNGYGSESRSWDYNPGTIGDRYAGLADEHRTYGTPSDTGGFGDRVKEAGRDAKDKLGELGDTARAKMEDLGDQTRDLGHQARERAERARRDMADRAYDARERASYHGRRAKQGVLQAINEQPLILGAIGLAIGAALGAAVPPSEVEDELMGETRDEALRRAKEVGREQAEKARDAAGAIVGAAREEASKQGLTPGAEPKHADQTDQAKASGAPGEHKTAGGPGIAGTATSSAQPDAKSDTPPRGGPASV